ncbi:MULTISPECIES: hypothetical protein [Streptomyces]|uniref:Uncharacterized protein n=2 Tax=Streptomyces TaxID=1883 RepID=A0A0B5EGX2_STRA4|nr:MULTISPECIES: hypothetical protein [Streptomyces]AJE81378.1 hypothetical protein SLNWT_1002 [Streptomyces albus]AOU75694.1 hypothetical protein SLNHY_1003 [Streptomyces albus]AYN31496.1 hypothetical protein DUI70_0993 [Streptomyces albus]NKI45127.1 hypothetical protein [Streptomyces physcomitrii]
MIVQDAYDLFLAHLVDCARCRKAPGGELCCTGRGLKTTWTEARRASSAQHRRKRTVA